MELIDQVELELIQEELHAVAERQFPDMMENAHVREDVEQELALVAFAALKMMREQFAWLQYELGIAPQRPTFAKPIAMTERRARRAKPRPDRPDGPALARGIAPKGFVSEFEIALDVERVAA